MAGSELSTKKLSHHHLYLANSPCARASHCSNVVFRTCSFPSSPCSAVPSEGGEGKEEEEKEEEAEEEEEEEEEEEKLP